MPFTTVITDTGEVPQSLVLEFAQQFLIAAAEQGVMDQFVSIKEQIGAKSIDFTKYAQLGLATTALTEDSDVTSEAMVDSQILLTPAEHGNVITVSALAGLQSGGKVDLAAGKLIGMNAGRSLDKLAILAAEGSANEINPGSGAEGAIVAGDVMTASFLNELYNKLSRSSVAPLQDGMFVAVMHDDVIHDLRSSASAGSWQDISKYGKSEQVLRNEIGSLAGFRIVRDNNISINTDAGATTVDTYHTLCLGFNALGKAVSKAPEFLITGPYDKLNRFHNFAWKACLQYGIVDQDALYMGTTSSSVGAN